MLLLDAGVWIASGMSADPWHDSAEELIRKPPVLLAALDLTLYEVANVVGVRDRRPETARTLTQILRRRCRDWIVTLDDDLLEATLEVASEHKLTAYDAAYVATARSNDWQLVSTDIRDLVSKGLAVTPDAALYP
ncbi:MAG TPA: type II toxin-antitoxin system VapC family toxin [Solirubrobacterales bacterium]|nr:type II toxin-antitoxin system VapC family toxin [Solirubrobacterales bacterium]